MLETANVYRRGTLGQLSAKELSSGSQEGSLTLGAQAIHKEEQPDPGAEARMQERAPRG